MFKNPPLLLLACFFITSTAITAQIRFEKTQDYLTGPSFIESITIADVNDDCLNDVIVMNDWYFSPETDLTIQVFLQSSDGQLYNATKFYYSNPKYNDYGWNTVVKAADFNNDNRKDIAVTFGDTLRIFHQTPSGTFQNPASYVFTVSSINSMDIGDINNDGLTDIALGGELSVENNNVNQLIVLYQQPNASFINVSYTIPGYSLSQIKIANVDNDCSKDVVAISDGRASVLYLNNDPTKNKIISKTYPFTNYFSTFNGVVVGRYGKDLRNSLLISTGGNESVNYQIDTDTSGIISDTFTYFDGGEIPTQIGMADFDNDGLNEIVVGHHGWEDITVYNDSANVKYNSNNFSSVYGTFNTTSMDVGDVNNDGLPDVVIGDQQASFMVHYNTTKPVIPILNNPRTVFYDCQTLKSTTTFKDSYFNRPYFTTTSGCNINTLESYKITQSYLTRYGIGDSLYYTTYCKKNPVYLKKDTIVYTVNLISIDTSFYQTISRTVTFPVINYTVAGLKEVCESQQINLSFQNSNPLKYQSQWYWENDSLNTNSLILKNIAIGNYQIPLKVYLKNDTVYCAKYDTIQVKINPTPIDITILGKDTVCFGERSIPYVISPSGNSIYGWTFTGLNNSIINNQSSVNLDINSNNAFILKAQEKNIQGCFGNITMKNVFVKKISDCLSIPNVFTPNHDGVNDMLEIKRIDLYPENTLKIYNRWGALIYQTTNYTGNWDANDVSDGIYYYTFEVNNQKLNGWLEVIR